MRIVISGDIPSESSPEIIAPFDFKMNDPKYRAKFLAHLLAKNYKQVDTYRGIPIYMTGIANHKGYLFATDGETLYYFVKFTTPKLRGLLNTIKSTVQVAIWRDDTSPQTVELSQYLFDGILTRRFGVMMSDGQQTPNGRRFWILRMTRALDTHKYVYLYNRMTHNLDALLDTAELGAAIKKAYGVGKSFRDNRFVISVNPIVGQK